MEQTEIIEKVQNGLKSCAHQKNIDFKDVRVKISQTKGFVVNNLKCHIMKQTDVLCEASLKDVLGIDMMKEVILKKRLCSFLTEYSRDEKIGEFDINGRFYTTQNDFSPRVYIYNKDTPVREITIQELHNKILG